ncbi:MAG: hypothetical protein KIT34_18240 [Cyanobacteria bacterium TGS_CYA1]|nr:hypothetical protein [Cyanobacteria bacterium TGS_CYA1]
MRTKHKPKTLDYNKNNQRLMMMKKPGFIELFALFTAIILSFSPASSQVIDKRIETSSGWHELSMDQWLESIRDRISHPPQITCAFARMNIAGTIDAEEAEKLATVGLFKSASDKMTDAINFYDHPELLSDREKTNQKRFYERRSLYEYLLLERAFFYRKDDKPEKALADLQRILAKPRNSDTISGKVSLELALLKRFDQAKIALDKALQENAYLESGAHDYLRAYIAENQNRKEEALSSYWIAANRYARRGEESASIACLEKVRKICSMKDSRKNIQFKDLKPPRENIELVKKLIEFVATSNDCFNIEKLAELTKQDLRTKANGEVFTVTKNDDLINPVSRVDLHAPDKLSKTLTLGFNHQKCSLHKTDIEKILRVLKPVPPIVKWIDPVSSVETYEIPSGILELTFQKSGFKSLLSARILTREAAYVRNPFRIDLMVD